MILDSIKLLNFKNYNELETSFSPDLNIITGYNGSGKTNLLDAIYFLCYAKSALNSTDYLNIKEGKELMSVRGGFLKEDKKIIVSLGLEKRKKKQLKVNKKLILKLSEHIGNFPLVLLTPYDTDLIRKGSEERRKFMDGIISQSDPAYLQRLLEYNKLLKQRNALLKDFAERKYTDMELLNTYTFQMLAPARFLIERRRQFLDEFVPVFMKNYEFISEEQEIPGLIYESTPPGDLADLFNENLKKDLILQRTSTGPHKDDIVMTLENRAVKTYGSQGQQKSFTTSLKLAAFDFLQSRLAIKPLLLLDDIFDKLDEKRIHKLIKLVIDKTFGQVFITDARLERSIKYFTNVAADKKVFEIDKGKLVDVRKI